MTGINSNNNIEVDGMPRHVLDLRPVVLNDPEPAPPVEMEDIEDDDVVERRFPRRNRRAPNWMGDYVPE